MALALACLAALGAAWLSGLLGPSFFRAPDGNDVWFEADLPQVHESLRSVSATQQRHVAHPLYPLFATLPVSAINAAGVSDRAAIDAWMAIVAALWAGALYVCLRLCRLGRLNAALFALAGMTSSSAVFWLSVPETFAIGSAAMLLALAAAAWPTTPDPALHVLALVATLGSTVTNGVCGALSIAVRFPARRAALLIGTGVALTLAAWAALHLVFPSLPFVLFYDDWRRFVLSPDSGGPLAVVRVLFVHSIVMPAIGTEWDPKWGAIMSVQRSAIGSAGWIGAAASACWIALLAMGALSLARARELSGLERVLVGTILSQVLLHLIFGEQTFLYTIHVAPLLLLVAARAARTRARPLAIALAAALVVLGAVNNITQVRAAAGFFEHGRAVPTAAAPAR